jgi:hypothetical protein
MKFLMILAMLILMSVSPTWAGCKSDCQDDYQSEVQSCRTNYDDPDDADELHICIDNAKSEYESCINDCED